MEDEHYEKLCANCSELWLRTLLALAYTFGFRKNELLGLRVHQVDLLNRSIILNPGTTKNRKDRVIKMTGEVYELLRECVQGKALDDHVLTRGTEPVKDFRGTWFALCEAAGLGKWLKDDKGREVWTGLTFHDLRRSAVRNMIRRGVQENVAMKISGHKTRSVFDRYNIVNEDDLARAASLIEQGAKKFGPAKIGYSLGTVEENGEEKTDLKPM